LNPGPAGLCIAGLTQVDLRRRTGAEGIEKFDESASAWPRSSGKRALLAGAALACSPAPSLRPAAAPAAARRAHKGAADGLQQDEMYMEADEVIRDDKDGVTTAHGNVEVRYNGRTLRADRLVYNDKTGVVRGYGHIIIVNADGTPNSPRDRAGRRAEAGVALGFSARPAAEREDRRRQRRQAQRDVQELNKAIYTPCEICAKDGAPRRTPLVDRRRPVVRTRSGRSSTTATPASACSAFRALPAGVLARRPGGGALSGFLVPKASSRPARLLLRAASIG
jgi:LPS-assembly protein